MEEIDEKYYEVPVDTDCIHSDFDEYDLFGELMEEEDSSDCDISFE